MHSFTYILLLVTMYFIICFLLCICSNYQKQMHYVLKTHVSIKLTMLIHLVASLIFQHLSILKSVVQFHHLRILHSSKPVLDAFSKRNCINQINLGHTVKSFDRSQTPWSMYTPGWRCSRTITLTFSGTVNEQAPSLGE